MNLSSIKDFFMDMCKAIYDRLRSSVFIHWLREKYNGLNGIQRKIIFSTLFILLVGGVLYYPASFLYSSWEYIRSSRDKKQLIRQMNHLSFALRSGSTFARPVHGNLKVFIQRQVSRWSLVKGQITQIKEIKSTSSGVNVEGLLTTSRLVEIQMGNLNLKEIVQYAKRLEGLSPYLKLIKLKMEEDKEEQNYFDVAYTLAFFDRLDSQVADKRKMNHLLNQRIGDRGNIISKKDISVDVPKSPVSLPQMKKILKQAKKKKVQKE